MQNAEMSGIVRPSQQTAIDEIKVFFFLADQIAGFRGWTNRDAQVRARQIPDNNAKAGRMFMAVNMAHNIAT